MIGFLIHRLRMAFWTGFYHVLAGGSFERLGRGARFQGWLDIPQRGGRIFIGRGVVVGRSVEFTVLPGAELHIGEGTFIGRGTLISAHCRVFIGAHVLIGENVSIHDNNHCTADHCALIREQGFNASPLGIGDGSWIGARAVLVQGAGLGGRCVLGAGAVLTRSLPDHTTAVGVPARPLRRRGLSEQSVPGNAAPQLASSYRG